jgi:FKBP-type peptidyl-prolyl cis-trans isomerase
MSVRLEIIIAGDGRTFAQAGQLVSIHYDAFLSDGTKFDSTRGRNRPLKFKLQSSEVIKGLDEGVSQISLGERAKITISPQVGWGAKGLPGLVPPNETVVFVIDLLSIH